MMYYLEICYLIIEQWREHQTLWELYLLYCSPRVFNDELRNLSMDVGFNWLAPVNLLIQECNWYNCEFSFQITTYQECGRCWQIAVQMENASLAYLYDELDVKFLYICWMPCMHDFPVQNFYKQALYKHNLITFQQFFVLWYHPFSHLPSWSTPVSTL